MRGLAEGLSFPGFSCLQGTDFNVSEEDGANMMRCAKCSGVVGAALCIAGKAYLQPEGLDERFFAHMKKSICAGGYGIRLCIEYSGFSRLSLGGGSLPLNHPRKIFLIYRNNLLLLYTTDPRSAQQSGRRVLGFMAG